MKRTLSIYAGTLDSDAGLDLNFMVDLESEALTAPYRAALTLVKKAMINNYLEPEDRVVLRGLIHPDTWKEREFDERLCRKYRFDPDLKVETWIRGIEVRFEALLELRNLLELTMLIAENEVRSVGQARAKEEQKQRLERDESELKAWWDSLKPAQCIAGLEAMMLSLNLSRKEMEQYWDVASPEMRTRLMGIAMYALEVKPSRRAKDVRARQEPKPMKKERGRRGHLRLVPPVAA
ncbi:MAG: hypothetical protein WCW31_02305 [Patescibacteria group bacterium]|jgi:hypothetical protein